jgi:hypothetical protein
MGLASLRKEQNDSGVLYLKRLLAATMLEQDYTEEGVLSQWFAPRRLPAGGSDNLTLVPQPLVVAIKVRDLTMGELLQPNPRLAVRGHASGSVDA